MLVPQINNMSLQPVVGTYIHSRQAICQHLNSICPRQLPLQKINCSQSSFSSPSTRTPTIAHTTRIEQCHHAAVQLLIKPVSASFHQVSHEWCCSFLSTTCKPSWQDCEHCNWSWGCVCEKQKYILTQCVHQTSVQSSGGISQKIGNRPMLRGHLAHDMAIHQTSLESLQIVQLSEIVFFVVWNNGLQNKHRLVVAL